MALPRIEAPTFDVKLISTGKNIKLRPFLVKEQKLFLMASESKDTNEVVDVIRQVLRNCIQTEGIDVDKLPTFDIENLFLQLRAKSVGEIVELKFKCNNDVTNDKGESVKCNNLVSFKVNLLDVKPTINKKHSAKIQLTPKLGVMMKYPTIELVNSFESDKNQVDATIDLIAKCIEYIYDEETIYYAKDTSEEELIDFIENLSQDDLEKIKDFFETSPKIEKTMEFKCSKCGYTEDIKVEGIQNFFG